MAKKERVPEVLVETPVEEVSLEPADTMYETDAYSTPQPDAGSDVTVTKPVGLGGPVPIVAPKHNTIQLQPIVVPLAVVPYMTQDSSVLRTDAGKQTQYVTGAEEYVEATSFEPVSKARAASKKKQNKWAPRIFALVTFLLTLVVFLPLLISHFAQGSEAFALSMLPLDIIGAIKGWVVNKSFEFNAESATAILFIIVAAFSAIMVLVLFIGILCGKYPKMLSAIFSFANSGILIGVLIWKCVKGFEVEIISGVKDSMPFTAKLEGMFIAMLVMSLLTFILSCVFSAVLNHMEDSADMMSRKNYEI